MQMCLLSQRCTLIVIQLHYMFTSVFHCLQLRRGEEYQKTRSVQPNCVYMYSHFPRRLRCPLPVPSPSSAASADDVRLVSVSFPAQTPRSYSVARASCVVGGGAGSSGRSCGGSRGCTSRRSRGRRWAGRRRAPCASPGPQATQSLLPLRPRPGFGQILQKLNVYFKLAYNRQSV